MPRKVLIQVRRGTEAELSGVILAPGELGFTTDTQKLYIGTPNGNVLLVNISTAGDMQKGIYDTNNDGKVDAAEAADSVPWAGIMGKPSEFPPSAHTHSNLLALDARSVATTPADYDKELKIQFKYLSAIGLSGVASGTYCQLLGYRAWGDDSGGKAHELAFTDGNDIYYRCGSEAGGWGAWNRLWHAGNLTPAAIGAATQSHTHGSLDTTGAWNYSNTPYGYIQFGPANTSYAHIYTDRPVFYFNKDLSVNGNTVWHAGNDGAGSGLDADKVDGHHVFVQSSQPTASAVGDIWIQI